MSTKVSPTSMNGLERLSLPADWSPPPAGVVEPSEQRKLAAIACCGRCRLLRLMGRDEGGTLTRSMCRRGQRFVRRPQTPTQRPTALPVQQCLGLFQIGRVEPFGEPAANRRQKVPRLFLLALLEPNLRQAKRSLQLE